MKVWTALTLSDWGTRDVKLRKLVDTGDARITQVTRELQIRALLPHTMVDEVSGSDSARDTNGSDTIGQFTLDQAIVRDCFDAYLDGLERFGSYLSTGLVEVEDLRPYLGYWIDDLVAPTKDPRDAAWAACVITYLHFYGYSGVDRLFRDFGHDIGPGGEIHTRFTSQMTDQALANRLKGSIATRHGGEQVT